MTIRNNLTRTLIDIITLIVVSIVFIVPFVFIFLTASKTQAEAAMFEFSLPSQFRLLENLWEVIQFRDYRMVLALWNSFLLTVGSVLLIVILAAGVAFVVQRRNDRMASLVSTLMLTGLIIPPAVVPTIFVLQEIGLYKTLLGLIFVEVSIQLPFAVLILRAFMASIPREIDEAAIIDGSSPWQLFFYVIFPLLRPAIITIVVVSAVVIYNDFTLPLYFLPGSENVTAQLTLFSFISQFSSRWDLLFADVIIITIPPLIMYIFFQREIVAGLTSGAVKG
ncbi:carbohydrate ABC transporter permease [Phototrophicus methaneseepsis]|uniref:Carbohydrate ABC transporter permease n=1 Tax=Phototrophicus methaneseepsis TaxID=2710758 RepID=A0A7S8EB58_9CHLR|nr:carbohydrate ABC transporter permease [Phototrophicus methaneseepsis]QPC83737.1 carbohydrate ABC transporter permease [Phototrophicus methaneseepsis]